MQAGRKTKHYPKQIRRDETRKSAQRANPPNRNIATHRNALQRLLRNMRQHYQLYLLILPAFAYIALFHYGPLYGIQLAFKDYQVTKGIWGSPFVGLEYFQRFISSYFFGTVIKNTLSISFFSLLIGFPIPILFALLLNEIRNLRFKKAIQTITYAPHFISVTVMAGMLFAFLSRSSGIINILMERLFGMEPIAFMQEAQYFQPVYILSEVWQHLGWNAILYIAVLSSVDMQQHEAALIDGANRFQRIWHINLPCLMPTIVIMLILSTGNLLSVGFEKIFLLQTPLNQIKSEIIATYVYKTGLVQAQYEFSTAVGLFTSVINCALLVSVNAIARRLNDVALW